MTARMENQLEQDQKESNRARALIIVMCGFVAPFFVLMLSGVAEWTMRASYALCLGAIMAGGGVWVAFRAKPDQLDKRWIPDTLKPVWRIFVKICGVLVIIGAMGFLLPATIQDVWDLVSSGRPRTFVEEARGVEGRAILHPVFQTVRLRDRGRYRSVYMFAYGGKRLVNGQRYVVTVLPRSHWILSAHEETETASR